MNHDPHTGASDTKSQSFLRKSPYIPISGETERIATLIVDAAFTVHKALGAGLLESVYEPCFCYEIQKRGLKFCYKREILRSLRSLTPSRCPSGRMTLVGVIKQSLRVWGYAWQSSINASRLCRYSAANASIVA
jgi:hypothetical protein